MTKDVGSGHWIRFDMKNSYPVVKIYLMNINDNRYNDLMSAFELRVGKWTLYYGIKFAICYYFAYT